MLLEGELRGTGSIGSWRLVLAPLLLLLWVHNPSPDMRNASGQSVPEHDICATLHQKLNRVVCK